jgi:hypothetical protein
MDPFVFVFEFFSLLFHWFCFPEYGMLLLQVVES